MGDGKAVGHTSMGWRVRLATVTFRVLCSTLLAALVVPAALWAQGSTAVVTGAERVFVRRGPGLEFPPFATLTQGSTVDVQELQGEWARISTSSGQVGYVNSNFLAVPGEKQRLAPPPGEAAAPAPRSEPAAHTEPTARAESAQLRSLGERNKALEADIRNLQQQVTEWKARAEATPVPVPAPTLAPSLTVPDPVQSELARLTAAIEQLQHRLDGMRSVDDLAPPVAGANDANSSHVVSPTAVLLGSLGILLGWLLGSGYGRKQERGRRSRIRF